MKPFKMQSSTQMVSNLAKFLIILYVLYKAILVSELYRLPRCIAPYKQSLS